MEKYEIVRKCRLALGELIPTLIDGMRVYHNFTKKHWWLKNKTPAEVDKIKVDGLNKWQTLIQNASLHTYE